MAWRRIALWTVTSAALLLAAMLVWLFTADLGVLKPQLEERLTRASGRTFEIRGDLSVRLGRRAVLIANDVHWQNASWGDGPDMLRIGRVEAEVDLSSLINGPVIIERITVRDARLQLAHNAGNESNWAIFESAEEEPEPVDGGPQVLLRRAELSNIDLHITRPERPVPLDVHIRSARQDVGDDDVVSASLNATANGRDISASGRLETWSTLLDGGRIDYDLDARLDSLEVRSHGVIDSLAEPRRPALHFTAHGPSIRDLFLLTGLGEHGVGDINLEGSLLPEDSGPLRLDIEGNLGQTTVDARGSFSELQGLDDIEATVRANGTDLGRMLPLLGVERTEEMPFALTADVQRHGPSLAVREATLDIGDAKLELRADLPAFPTLAGATASARLQGSQIERLRMVVPIPDGVSGAFTVEAELDASDGNDDAFHVDARTPLGIITASGSLGPAPEHFGSRMHMIVEGYSLASIAATWGIDDLADVAVTMIGDLEFVAEGLRTRGAVTLTVGSNTAGVEGVIGTRTALRGTDLSVRLRGESLADLGRSVYPASGLPDVAYDLNGNVVIDDTGYRLQKVIATIGQANLRVSGLISRRRDLAGSRVSALLEGPALEALVPAIGGRAVRPGPFSLAAEAAIGEGTVRVDPIRIEREFADLTATLELGWPLSFDPAKFAIQGKGRDVRLLFGEIGPVELDSLPFSVAAVGSRHGSAWEVSRLDLKLGDAEAHVKGKLDYGDTSNATRLKVNGTIPSLARLGTIGGKRLRDSPVALHATVTSDDDSLAASDLRIDIEEGSIGGTVEWQPGPVPLLDVALRSDYLVLHPITVAETEEPVANPHFDDGRLIPDVEVPFATLQKLDASIRLDVARFVRGHLELKDLVLSAELRAGALNVPEFRFRGESGTFHASAALEPDKGTGRAKIDIVADGLRLNLNDDEEFNGVTADFVARLESRGTGPRAIAGNSDGFIFLDARKGRLPNFPFLQAIYGDLLDEILSTINPFSKTSAYTQIDCVVTALEITGGQLKSAPRSLILTDKVQIVTENAIDLDTEAIDFNFRTTPRKTLGVSAAEMVNPYVKVVGTLAAPRLAVDQRGILVSGGAAVATGGLSVLAKATWDRLSKSGDPCGAAVAAAHEALPGRLAPSN